MPDQRFEFVQLLVVDRVAIEQVHHQCRGRSLKRAVEKTLRQAPSDFIARYTWTENKCASAMCVPDKTLTFHDAQQTLHGLVIRRRARAQSVDDVFDCAVPQIPENIQDQQFGISGEAPSGYRTRFAASYSSKESKTAESWRQSPSSFRARLNSRALRSLGPSRALSKCSASGLTSKIEATSTNRFAGGLI